jgi:ribonuclease-3
VNASAQAVPGPDRERLIAALGVDVDPDLLFRALTHRSFAYENGGLPTNERLEFLGDAVLGLVVTAALYRRHPDLAEGQLAKLRAAVVNMRALAGVARELGLGEYVLLGRGEEASGGRDKSSILADTVEAIFGAVYLQHGIAIATELVHRLVDPLLQSSAELGAGLDWKTSLQELTATASLGVPEYAVTEEGPDHAKLFHAVAIVQARECGSGSGRSKKEAEQSAAAAAFQRLQAELAAAAAAEDADNADGAPSDVDAPSGNGNGVDGADGRRIQDQAEAAGASGS